MTTVLALVVTGVVLTSLTSTFLGLTTGASVVLAASLVTVTGAVLTTGVDFFFTDSTGLTVGVSTFLTVSVVLTAGVAGLICLVSTLVDAAFTGVVLAGSALITSFLASFLAGATANEVANCFTGCATLFSVLTFKVLVWTGVLTSAALFAFTVTVAVLTGAAGA